MELREFGGLIGPYVPPAHGGAPTQVMMLLHGWGLMAMILLIWRGPMRSGFRAWHFRAEWARSVQNEPGWTRMV